MVNMIGFAPPSPHYNTAGFGEPGHYFTLHPKGNESAVVAFPCGTAFFASPEDARSFLGLPGDVGRAAAFYLAEVS